MPVSATFRAVTLDCPDPPALARFYRELAGLEVAYSQEAYAGITVEPDLGIGFQRVEGYQPPEWPGQSRPQQFHLDFGVPDLDEAEKTALALGATKPDFQPGAERWRVLLDPAGHPFCLVAG